MVIGRHVEPPAPDVLVGSLVSGFTVEDKYPAGDLRRFRLLAAQGKDQNGKHARKPEDTVRLPVWQGMATWHIPPGPSRV
ncbi:hypothetical protein DSM19430T_00140 [Desulfovibrio psychrotolerans]|uniref:Uncharacterized protein n=1 Tax=Desulfovibrio psychrotolerans TaxID=415242 RepID=A0A7J0BNT4_9BACT|nr:hypothetical protein DSM19430T_00140 [Desulfovibrio psychrotolerans]